MPERYRLLGWCVQSEILLPELPAWPDDAPADLTITLGAAPALAGPLAIETPVMQADAAGVARFALPGVACYRVEQGRQIAIEPAVDPTAPDIRLFLYGSVLALLCHQRGVTPLGAAAVEIDGRALLLAGGPASGKSTLAAAFARRGHRLIADDVAAIAGGMVLPGVPRLMLWGDMLDAFGWRERGTAPCRTGLEKFALPADFTDKPGAPLALLHLHRHAASLGDATFHRLRGGDAVQRFHHQQLRFATLAALVGQQAAFTRAARAAAAVPRHYLLSRPLDFAGVDGEVDMILETLRGAR